MSGFSRTKSTLILIFASIGSNILGIARNHFFATHIPTSELSSYYAAFRIPDLVYNLVVFGLLSSIFIPVFMGEKSKSEEGAFNFANNMINFTLVFVSAVSVVLFFLMPYLTELVVPGFSTSAKNMTMDLSRIMLISPLIFGLSSIVGGILNSYKKFVAYSLAPLFYNAGIIFGTLFFTEEYGVYGIAYGVLLGALLHLLIQLPSVFKLGYSYKPILNLKDNALKEIGKMAPPRIGGLIATQANFFILTIIGSLIGKGAITYLNFANDMQTFVSVVFGLSFATISFPLLAEKASKEENAGFISEFSKSFRQILYFAIPASIGLILLRAQLTRLILGYGYFKFADTILTSAVLGAFAISLFAQSTLPLLVRAFYALKDTKTPFIASVVAVIVNIIGSLFIPQLLANYVIPNSGGLTFSVVGLALSFSLASIMNMLILLFFLHSRLGDLEDSKTIISLIKITVSSIVMVFAVQVIKYLASPIIDPKHPVFGFVMQTLVVIAGGAAAYLLTSFVLKSEEIHGVKDILNRYKRKSA
ncbi:murein biosynthesis integral membrane protein MurJ [bacterium]|nr:murein biosynthesis integral membrane protein MurJ [bacterium]